MAYFTNFMRCCYDFEQVTLRHIFNSIKETTWLISKVMCVLLFNVFIGCSEVKK